MLGGKRPNHLINTKNKNQNQNFEIKSELKPEINPEINPEIKPENKKKINLKNNYDMHDILKDKFFIRLLIESPGKFYIKNNTFIFNEEENLYQVFFESKDIDKKYIKKFDNIQNKLTLEIPMFKNGNKYAIIIHVNLNTRCNDSDIINCNFFIKSY
jgi:hypothetical protein